MDDVGQEKMVAETKTRGLGLAYSGSSGNKNSESRTAIIKRRKRVAHRRKLKRSHANG
jgi:hypothetical protein